MMNPFKNLGPGLLYAGAAVGVSHIVQSTQAGARFGLVLILAIFIAHIVKYPFFKMGPWYASLTGKSLVDGYFNLGKWAAVLIFLLTFSTMFTIQAAVTLVTAGIAQKISGISLPGWQWSAVLLAVCLGILSLGHYRFLSKMMKWIILVLSLTTIIAAVASFFVDAPTRGEKTVFAITQPEHLLFLIAFLGWMPAPLDLSIWHSLWTTADAETQGNKGVKQALFDFKTGFWGTAILACFFLLLGANVFYGSGIALESGAAAFAGQFMDLYSTLLGSWAYPVIAIAAFTTMFSTTLTCLDASPRLLRRMTQIFLSKGNEERLIEITFKTQRNIYSFWIVLLASGTLVILGLFIDNMRQMVNLATSISFITTPLIALMSFMVMRKATTFRKVELLYILSSLLILLGFAAYYLWTFM